MKLLLICKTLAPYRVDLYSEIEALNDGETKVLVGSKPSYHAWDGMEDSDLFQMMDASKLPIGWLKRLGLTSENKGSVLLPSRSFYKQIKEYDPDVLWIHEFSPLCILAYYYARKRNKKIVLSTELGEEIKHQYSWFNRFIHKRLGKKVDVIIANSSAAKMPLSGKPERVVFAPHAVSSEDFQPNFQTSANELRLLFVGNMIERKGVDLLIEALKIASEKAQKVGVDVTLNIAGGGDKDWVEGLVKSAGTTDRMNYLGFLQGDDLINAYGDADVLVLPSRFDSYGVVSHEGACAGLILIISDACGSSEVLIDEGKNGFVVKSGSVESLETAISQIVSKVHSLDTMKIESRRIGEEHCVKKVAASVYEKITNS